MPMDKVQICNIALGWLGGNPIMSVDDLSTEAMLCKQNYDLAREFTLEARDWSFAKDRYVLLPMDPGPPFEYSHWFQLPAGYSRVTRICKDEKMKVKIDWVKEGNVILANNAILYMYYIKKITDESIFPSGFTNTLVARLAADIALSLTASRPMAEAMEQKYRMFLEESGTMDGMQGRNEELKATKLTGVR